MITLGSTQLWLSKRNKFSARSVAAMSCLYILTCLFSVNSFAVNPEPGANGQVNEFFDASKTIQHDVITNNKVVEESTEQSQPKDTSKTADSVIANTAADTVTKAPAEQEEEKDLPVKLCKTKLNTYSNNAFVKAKIFGQLTQNNLNTFYQHNNDYQAAKSALENKELNDDRYGEVTQFWLTNFCEEFSLANTIDDKFFIENLLTTLMSMAELTQAYENWKDIINDEKFKAWSALHIENTENCKTEVIASDTYYGCPARLHVMVDQYQQSVKDITKLDPINTNYKELSEDNAPNTTYVSADCGCAIRVTDEIIDDSTVRNYYGFYFDWLKYTEGINFSQLTRIGYFTSLNVGDTLNEVTNKKEYLEFVIDAHKHRVAVDLVISTQPLEVMPDYNTLIENIVSDIKIPIKERVDSVDWSDRFVDSLKPILSFGESDSRLIIDGVTLNFTAKQIQAKDDDNEVFNNFIKDLKINLTCTDSKGLDDKCIAKLKRKDKNQQQNKQQEEKDVASYVNLMVPVNQIYNETGVYSLANLLKISPHVNLFIVTAGKEKSDNSMKALRAFLGKYSDEHNNENEIGELFTKIVPMFAITEPETGVKSVKELNYIDWNYNGLAYWPLPINIESYQNNLNTDKTTIIAGFDPCKYICPNRWVVRTLLFVTFVLLVLYTVMSFWLYRLKTLFHSRYFMPVIVVVLLIVMSALYCDPYWMQKKGQLFAGATLIALLLFAFFRMKRNRAKTFP